MVRDKKGEHSTLLSLDRSAKQRVLKFGKESGYKKLCSNITNKKQSWEVSSLKLKKKANTLDN